MQMEKYLKVSITKEEWKSIEQKARFRAFTVAKLGSATLIDTVKQQLLDVLEDGKGYAEFWNRIKQTVENDVSKIKPGYWETVFRTNTQTAYVAGKLQQYENSGVVAYQLMVIEDVRTSQICRNLLNKNSGYGIILPVEHPFWKKYGFPPYHFNCRSSIRGVWPSQVGKIGNVVTNPGMKSIQLRNFKPQGDFGGNPLVKGSWWELTSGQMEQAKELGILEELLKKNLELKNDDKITQFDFYKNLKNDDKEVFLSDYKKLTADGRKFFEKYGEKLEADLYMSTRGYYSSLDNKIHLNLHNVDVKSMEAGFKTNITTFLHESGHWFDYNALDIPIRDKLPKLKEYLTQDAINYTNNFSKEKINIKGFERNTSAEKKLFSDISKEIWKNSSTNSSISDIFEGVTNAKIVDGYGHGKTYWKRPQHLEKEAIAEMFEAFCVGGNRQAAMEKYFPTAFNYFVKFMGDL